MATDFYALRRVALASLIAASGCMLRPSDAKVEALEREVASLTSIALTVERLPNKTGGEFLIDRTPEQRERIARSGEEIRAHVRELAGR